MKAGKTDELINRTAEQTLRQGKQNQQRDHNVTTGDFITVIGILVFR